MNTPNKLTLLRVALVPVFVFFLMVEFRFHFVWALLFFVTASLTDLLDGHLARKYRQVTTFGKFLDPLADKVLTLSAMVCLVELGLSGAVAVVLIIARELMVTSLRLTALSGSGRVIAAGWLGKAKTVVTMIALTVILALAALGEAVPLPFDAALVSKVLMWVCAGITIVSGVWYLVQNWDCVGNMK